MIEPLSLLWSPYLLFWSLGIFSIMYCLRAIVEIKFSLSDNLIYQHLILPVSPIVMGGCLGLIKDLPVPVELISGAGHILFGVVAGLLSSKIYQVIVSGISNVLGSSKNV